MNCKVLLFAAARAAVGAPQIEVPLSGTPDVGQLRRQLEVSFPALRNLLSRSVIAVNQQVADGGTRLRIDDEVAWIPPVSGG